MRRWTFTLFLGLSAAAAVVMAPRLFGRVPDPVEGLEAPQAVVEPVVAAEPLTVDPEAAWLELPSPPSPPLPPRPVHVRTGPEVHPIHTRRTDTDAVIPELAEPIPAVPVVPAVPDDFWPPLPACGMG